MTKIDDRFRDYSVVLKGKTYLNVIVGSASFDFELGVVIDTVPDAIIAAQSALEFAANNIHGVKMDDIEVTHVDVVPVEER